MITAMLSDATPEYLLSPWKPVLMCATFIAWAWLMSKHLDKDARAAHLNPLKWNGIHLAAACIALFIMLFGRIFYLALPIGILVLLAPILVYWKVRNEEVSEEYQFHLGLDTVKSAIDKRKMAKTNRQVAMTFKGANGVIKVPEKDDPQLEIYLAAEDLINKALTQRASRLEFLLNAKGAQGMYLVDGVQVKLDSLSPDVGAKVSAFLKEAAGTDPTDARRLQTGEFDIGGDTGSVHVNLTTSGSSKSHQIRLEFDRAERVLRTWESTGLLQRQRDLLDQLKDERRRRGIVLIGGERQSGVTTTGYAILSQHDSYLCNIVTLEHEVIAVLEGITHNTCEEGESNYAAQLQTLIRRDPEVILAADLQSAEAAKIAAKPGKDGPLIFISMSASSINDLVSKWAGLVSDPRKSFEALQAVVYQRLVRRLCENCRVPYKPSSDLAKQGLPVDSVEQLFRKGGQVEHKNKVIQCPICDGSGYMGQVGVFETMFLDTDTRKHLIAGDLKAAMAHARRHKRLIRLQEAAWEKVATGETSLEELGRITSKRNASSKTKNISTNPQSPETPTTPNISDSENPKSHENPTTRK